MRKKGLERISAPGNADKKEVAAPTTSGVPEGVPEKPGTPSRSNLYFILESISGTLVFIYLISSFPNSSAFSCRYKAKSLSTE